MSNGECHVGSANKAKIESAERRVVELSKTINEMFERFDESQHTMIQRMDRMYEEFTKRLDHVSERFAGRPSWAIMLMLSGLSSLCVGLVVYLIKVNS